MSTVRPVAAYSLVLVSPTREERRTAPVATVGEAAERAALSLWLSGRASGDAAQDFAQTLTTLTEGETLRHAPSGFSARIEWVGQLTPPAPDAPLRITKTKTRLYGYAEDDTAQTWEVRTHGAASLRTYYTRWVRDGRHDGPRITTMHANGNLYRAAEPRTHRAGDLYARTAFGLGSRMQILVPERQIAGDSPADRLILP